MAKKVVKLSLKDQLSELESKEQTPEVMAEIDAIKLQIEEETAKEKALEDEIARNKAEKEAKAKEKADKKAAEEAEKIAAANLPNFTHEEWSLEKKIVDKKVVLTPLKMLKKCILLQEHVDHLNNQRENTLREYIEIKKGE